MSVFKRGKVWSYEFMHDGQRYRHSTRVKNKRDAEEIERAKRTALAKGEVGIKERKAVPNFQDAMKNFLSWSKNSQKASTYLRYVTSSKALLRCFSGRRLNQITSEDVLQYRSKRGEETKTVRSRAGRKRTKTKLRPATVNRELACLKALFNSAIKADVLAKNPVSGVKPIPEDNLQTRVVSLEEQKLYLFNGSSILRDIAGIILETGMRPEEVYRLRCEDVDLAEHRLHIRRGKTPAAKRTLLLTSEAERILRSRKEGTQGCYLFPCELDLERPVPKVNNAHDRAIAKSKVQPFRLYDLRHTWAGTMAMTGIDLVTLAAMLGHSRIQMVIRYAHPTQDHQNKAMKQFEAFVAAQQMAESIKQAGLTQ